MAVYDGFFDAVRNEETGKYDREYGSDAFTEYFGELIGSGVCVRGNPDSMKVRLEDGKAVVSPGWLFIRGYWLKNDAGYPISLTETGPCAIVATLNMGRRMIDLSVQARADAYPDALVLAYVDAAAGSVEDTRYRTDICGVIDSAGDMARKVQFALDYIDNDIADRLAQLEQGIAAKEAELDQKIEEAGAEVEKIAPLPIGSIKFTAAPDPGEGWLRCDGRFVSKDEYPELVDILRKFPVGSLSPQKLCEFPVNHKFDSSTIYNGHLLLYHAREAKIYCVSLVDGTINEITLTYTNTTAPHYSKISVVREGSTDTIYLTGESGSKFNSSTWTEQNEQVDSIEVSYCYGNNFNIKGSSVSLSYVEKTVPFSAPPEYPDLKYILDSDSGDQTVMRFGNLSYVVLGYLYITNYKHGSGYTTPNETAAARGFVVSTVGQEEPVVSFYLIERKSYIKTNTTNPTIKDFTFSSYLTILPGFSEANQGFVYLTRYVVYEDNYNGLTVRLVEGGSNKALLKIAGEVDSNIYDNNMPVRSPNYLVLSGIVSDRNSCHINYITHSDGNMTRRSFYNEKSFDAKCIAYIEENHLWVFANASWLTRAIAFSSDLSDGNQYIFFEMEDLGLPQYSGRLVDSGIIYERNSKKLILFLVDNVYTAHIFVMEISAEFDPVHGSSLPILSLSGIPGYIKAKEETRE